MLDLSRYPSDIHSVRDPGPIYRGITEFRANCPKMSDHDFEMAREAHTELRRAYKTKAIFTPAARILQSSRYCILYKVYTADLPHTKDVITATFADDTAMLGVSNDGKDILSVLLAHLNKIWERTRK